MTRADYLREMYEAKADYEFQMITARDAYLSLTVEERGDTEVTARYTGLKQWFAYSYGERRARLIAQQTDEELAQRVPTTVAPLESALPQ